MAARLSWLVVFITLAALAGCGAAANPVPPAQPAAVAVAPTAGGATAATPAAAAPSAPRDLGTVRMGHLGVIAEAGLYIALERGYFADQGLTVDLQRFDSAVNMIAPLAAGQLDAGAGAVNAGLFNAVARGVEIQIVATEGGFRPGVPMAAVVARSELIDSGQVRELADLVGRRVAVTARGMTAETWLQDLLRHADAAQTEVQLTQMGFSDIVSALASGNLDAASLGEPFIYLVESRGIARVLHWDYDLRGSGQVATIFYSPLFMADRPAAARAWMVAYVRGLRDYNDAFAKNDPRAREEVIDILAKWSSIKDRAVLEQIRYPYLDPTGAVNVDSLKQFQEVWVAAGLQQRPIDVDAVADMQFVRHAVAQLGAY